MKALMIITGSGPIVVLSSHETPHDEIFVGKLRAKGIEKFLGYELPLDQVKKLYGGHFQMVVNDLHESDDLRVLDVNGHRVFELFRLGELGAPFVHE
jgi:hypothetical protein